MVTNRVLSTLAAGAAVVVLATITGAQGPRVTVHGIAYDSLRGEPLANAFVTILGRSRSTTADSRGRFLFDTLPPGTYTFTAQHDDLDSLGLSGISARATVTDGRDEVVLAVPSFASFWRTACAGAPPRDSGLVYGTVRDAGNHAPVAYAEVAVTWLELRVIDGRIPAERRWRRETQTDSTGGFGVCGVPIDVGLRIRARADSFASDSIDLPIRQFRVRRRDLTIGPVSEPDSAQRGSIAGLVTSNTGGPVANARITTGEVPEARTGPDGRFTVRSVPTGTRQVEIQSLGMLPAVVVVDVVAGETATLAVELRLVTTLDVVSVTGTLRARRNVAAFEERRKGGLGYARDSAAINGLGTMANVFVDLPGVTVRRAGRGTRFVLFLGSGPRQCVANLFIDGIRQRDYEPLNALHADEIAAVEAFPRGLAVPPEFQVPGSICGAVAVWTKYAFR